MMRWSALLVVALALTSVKAIACETQPKEDCPKPVVKAKVKPKVKKVTKVQEKIVTKVEKEQCCDTKANTTTSKAASIAHATTGNQNITINMPQPTKTVVKKEVQVVEKKVYVDNPNRLQLLIGESKTKQQVQENACGCQLTTTRVYEPDIGLQYLRDFGSFTGSLTGTANGAVYVGLGFNWK